MFGAAPRTRTWNHRILNPARLPIAAERHTLVLRVGFEPTASSLRVTPSRPLWYLSIDGRGGNRTLVPQTNIRSYPKASRILPLNYTPKFGAHGGTRTPNISLLRRAPLPIGLRGHCMAPPTGIEPASAISRHVQLTLSCFVGRRSTGV